MTFKPVNEYRFLVRDESGHHYLSTAETIAPGDTIVTTFHIKTILRGECTVFDNGNPTDFRLNHSWSNDWISALSFSLVRNDERDDVILVDRPREPETLWRHITGTFTSMRQHKANVMKYGSNADSAFAELGGPIEYLIDIWHPSRNSICVAKMISVNDEPVPYVAEFGEDEDGPFGPFVSTLDQFNSQVVEANESV